jgi:DNA-binding CsgD family transcriptional regulator
MGHNTGVCFSKMNLLSAMVALKKYSRADSVLKGCKSCLENSNSRVRMSLNFIEAHIAWAKKDYSKAKSILEKIVHDTTGSGLLPILNDAKLMLANILWQSGVHHEALRLGREVYSMSRSTGSFNAGYESAKFLSACYRETGPCDSSLLYASSAGIFQDSLFTAAGHENMDELEMRYKSQLLGQQLTILKGQEDLNDRRTIIIVITAIFLLVVLLLLIILLWLRQKRLHSEKLVAAGVQALAEKEILLQRSRVEQISLERQLQDQEISRLNVNLGLKEQDLVLQSLLKANTLNLIKSLMDRLAPFSFRLTRKMDQEEFNLMLLQLNKEIDFSPLDDFEKLFKELHPGFYGNLCAAVPDLSQNDLIICAMLRLNLSSKDISRIANISVSTVESGRSRIRKKLGIDSGSGLVSTLMKF